MSLSGLILSVALVWAAIHALHAFFLNRSSRLPSLPVSGSGGRGEGFGRARPAPSLLASSEISVHGLRLLVSTSAWNEVHDRFSGYLLRRRNRGVVRWLKAVYGVGVAVGVCGVVGACVGGVWAGVSFVRRVLAVRASGAVGVQGILKRGVEDYYGGGMESFGVTLIIPGVTVPLSDLPFIVISVFVSQVVHELGHAIAAALESVPILSCGASLTVIIPAAFVSLSTPLYRGLGTLAKARVVSAGPFHNLVMWACLLLVRTAGLNQLFVHLLYENVSETGRIVVDVDQTTPLAGYLVPGVTLVKQLDDTTMASKLDIWSQYLNDRPPPPSKGWCIATENFKVPSSCCFTKPGASPSPSCFLTFPSSETSVGCMDPVSILTNTSAVRCDSTVGCQTDEQCSAPDTTQLMRLTVRQHGGGSDQVLLWSGPRREIKERVIVGIWKPHLVFPTIYVLEAYSRLWSYLEMAALSLYLLNLLPLPFLDGMELVHCVVQGGSRTRDMEDSIEI